MSDKDKNEQVINLGISELLQDKDSASGNDSQFAWLNRELGEEALPNVVLASRAIDQLEDEKIKISEPELDSIGKLIHKLDSEGETELVKLLQEKINFVNPNQNIRHSNFTYKILLFSLLLVASGICYLLWKHYTPVPATFANLPALELKPVIKPNLVFQMVEPPFKTTSEPVRVAEATTNVAALPAGKTTVDTSGPLEPERIKDILNNPETKDTQKVTLGGVNDGLPLAGVADNGAGVNGFPQQDNLNVKTKPKRVYLIRVASKVYRYPDFRAPKIGYLNRDDQVRIVSDLGEWVKIRSDFADGYVPADILEVDKP